MESGEARDELRLSVPLECDTLLLKDVEEKEDATISTNLVWKIVCTKFLNMGVAKNILVKAWGEQESLSTTNLGPTCICLIS